MMTKTTVKHWLLVLALATTVLMPICVLSCDQNTSEESTPAADRSTPAASQESRPITPPPSRSPAEEAIEYRLAVINARGSVRHDDITVARFRKLLELLSSKYVEDRQQIADMTVTAQKMLREAGVDESLLNIMEGMNRLFYSEIENQKYAEYAVMYATLREQGQTHDEAITGLREVFRSMGIH